MQAIFNFFSGVSKEFAMFIISMIPLIELRGSIPFGAAVGMEWWKVFGISIVGNLLPIPFIIFFGEHLFRWLRKTKLFAGLFNWYETRLLKKAQQVEKYALIGLCLFVAIPLPGTGAWSGAALAVLLNMSVKKAFLSIICGVLIAGVIMTIGSYGLIGALKLF